MYIIKKIYFIYKFFLHEIIIELYKKIHKLNCYITNYVKIEDIIP